MQQNDCMATAESVVRSWDYERSTDRRAYERVPLGVPVLIDNLKAWVSAKCKDVSVTGLGLSVEPAIALGIGEFVEVYFELPNGVAIEAKAQVMRNDGHHLGLRFVQLDRGCRMALGAHCRNRED